MRQLILLPVLLLTTALAQRQPVPPGGFTTCAPARIAGYTSMRRGEPDYLKKLGRGRDGIACEPKQR